MSVDATLSALALRCNSLEDIVRQQEQTVSVLLGRIRDLEQFVGNEARNRDANQNQINQLLSDRSTDNLSERIGVVLQSQAERLSALQADAQAQRAALQGLDGKVDAAFHGLENKVQGDVRTMQERLTASEHATAEALKTTQASLQSQASAVQQIDSKCREAMQGLQSMVRDASEASRSSVEALESRTRDALRDLHSTLSGDVKAASAQQEQTLHQAIRNQNEAMLTLDQRVRGEVAQLLQQEQADFQTAQKRLVAIETTGRELVQAAQSGLAAEIAAVAAHSQAVDNRQQSAHQSLVQELAKHDQQMETIDVSWRASVMDLNGKVDSDIAATRGQSAAVDQALQDQVGQLRDQLRTVGDQLNHRLNEVAGRMQDACVVPLERLGVTVGKQEEATARLVAEGDKVREFLRVFSQEVDKNANQIRQVMESTLRSMHSDMLERINVVSASVALRQDPEAVYAQINEALSRIWSDSSAAFATQRDVNDVQSLIASLESAIRVEIRALAEKDNDLHRRVDELQVPLRWVVHHQQQLPPSESQSAKPPTATAQDTAVATNTESAKQEIKLYASTAAAAQDECVRMANDMRAALNEVRQARALVEKAAERDVVAPPTAVVTRTGGEDAQPPHEGDNAAARAVAAQRQEEATARAEALLAEVQQLQQGITAQQEDLKTLIEHERARQTATPTPTPTAKGKGERASSAGSVRRVSGTQVGNTFFVRDLNADGDNVVLESGGASGAQPDAPSPMAYTGRNNEMLLPTHQFVRKKEYANFKDFTKQELDTLWVEVLNLRRATGVSREELMVHLSQSKSTILSGVLNAMSKQENDMLAILSSLKRQVTQSLGDGTVRTDVKIFPPHKGSIDIDQLIRDVDSLSAQLGHPTPLPVEGTSSQLPPRQAPLHMAPDSTTPQPPPYTGALYPPPPPPFDVFAQMPPPNSGRGHTSQPNAYPSVVRVPAAQPLPQPSPMRSPGPRSGPSSARSTEPLPTQLIPRVAPYAVGAVVPEPEAIVHDASSPQQPEPLVATPRTTKPRLQAAQEGPQTGVARAPMTLVGSQYKPASPLPPPSLSRGRLTDGPGAPLPHIYATEAGAPCAVHATNAPHVAAWERDSPPSAHRLPAVTAGAPKATSAPPQRNPKGGAFHLNPLQGVPPANDDAPEPPRDRPTHSAPATQAPPRPYPTTANTATSPVSYPTEEPAPPPSDVLVEEQAWEQTVSDGVPPEREPLAVPSPHRSKPKHDRPAREDGPDARRRSLDMYNEKDEDSGEYHDGDDDADGFDDESSTGRRSDQPHRPRRSRRKGTKSGHRKPRSRSGSRPGRHSSAPRRAPHPASRRSRSASPSPSDSEELVHTETVAPPSKVEPAPAPKPRPTDSANIRVYPSPEGVRVGTYPQAHPKEPMTGGTAGHIYAPTRGDERRSTFSSAPYDEL